MNDKEAGQELDILVAEKVMGKVPCTAWDVFRQGSGGGGPAFIKDAESCGHKDCYPLGFPACYSTNIAAAWQVVERLVANGATPQIYYSSGQWWVRLSGLGVAVGSETVSLAICRAALKI